MKTPILSLVCFGCVLIAGAVALHAQPPANSADTTAPSYDMKAQALLDLQAVNKSVSISFKRSRPTNSPGALHPTPGPSLKFFSM